MSEPTIRERVESIQKEILKGELNPQRASEMMVELSAIFGNVNTEIRQRDMEYNKILLACYESETKANRAKIRAEISPEYEAKMVARNTKELLVEMVRALKYYQRSFGEEYQTGSNF